VQLKNNDDADQKGRSDVAATTTPAPTTRVAILITEGYGAIHSSEVFLPWKNNTCLLPSRPNSKADNFDEFMEGHRQRHVQSGKLLCGGFFTERSCMGWRQGGWVTLPVTLLEKRIDSSAWSLDNRLLIMGGSSAELTSEAYSLIIGEDFEGAAWTSESVSSDGSDTRSSFRMKYATARACSIPLGDEVVITGGVVTRKTVSRYNKDGWVEDMPSLNQGRTVHGCTTFVSLGEQVLMVAGGLDGSRLDSTEILRPGSVWQEITAKLPRPMFAVRMATVDNRVLLFGGDSEWHTSNLDFSSDILEYTGYNGYTDWRKVGALKTSRSYHGISLINFKDFDDYCN